MLDIYAERALERERYETEMAELRKTDLEHERMKDSADASAQALGKLLKRVEQLEKQLEKKSWSIISL